MSKPSTLRQFVRSVLHEGAATAKMASQRNLALMTYEESDNYRTYTLFDRNAFVHTLLEIIHEAVKGSPEYPGFRSTVHELLKFMRRSGPEKDWVMEQMVDRCRQYMVATADVERHYQAEQGGQANGAWQMHGPAAVDKDGPLIYDIAMADTKELMPDRRTPSASAQKIWKFYKNSRPDVVSTPLDNADDPVTPQVSDDSKVHNPGRDNFGNFLDSSYHLAGSKPNVADLRSTYRQMTAQLKKKKISSGFVKRILIDASESFFYKLELEKKSA